MTFAGNGRRKDSGALQDVCERLEEDIVFGRLKPRERLVEDDLMARFDAKRHVIREALVQLERICLVQRKRNCGASVYDHRPEDVEQIYEIRRLLERRAAERIPLPAPDLVARLEAIHEEYCAAVDAGDLRRVFRLNMRFHQAMYDACGNVHLAEAINTHAQKSHGIRFYAIGTPDLLAAARREHGGMIQLLREGNRDALVELCVRHLMAAPKAYVEAYRRLYL